MNFQIHTQIKQLPKGTRILFANVAADGHFNPLTGLAVYLRKKGCDVRWYTSKDYAQKVSSLGIPFYPFKNALNANAGTNLDEIFPERQHKSGIDKLRFDFVNFFILRGPEYYEDLREIHSVFPFEVLIADITFGGIPYVKERMNIPVISISIIPLPETSKDLAPAGLGIPPSKGVVGRMNHAFLRFAARRLIFAGPNRIMKQLLARHGIDCGNLSLFDLHIKKSDIVLQSGTPAFEYERSDMSKNIHFAGPLLPYKSNSGQPAWFDDRLYRFDKILLVTQGTVEKDINKLLVPALEAFKNSDCLVIATTGGSNTQQLKARYESDNVIVENFIPFNDVLPYADVYISNGGYGGVLMSIQNGVPMVVAGVQEGKSEINARVGYFKLGINLKTETPGILQLRKSVEAILESGAYRKNVMALRSEFNLYDGNLILHRQLSALLSHKAQTKKFETDELVY